jgi:protocatechuate 3,4-dioxygenase alpha subunit
MLATEPKGEQISIRGSVYDSEGVGVPDAMLEFWHAGHLVRAGTDATGAYSVDTTRPTGGDGLTQAPHLSLAIFARGLLNHLYSRVYFPEEATNTNDSVLLRVPAARRATLIAQRAGERAYRFDVVLQGSGETVFFDFK